MEIMKSKFVEYILKNPPPYLSIDIETTGLDRQDEIVSAAVATKPETSG